MDYTDPDMIMIIAGVGISLLALIELYSNWKNTQDGRTA
jgi:hypothetical protein